MGYETEFTGSFQLSHPLQENHLSYLMAFARTRRIMRDDDMVKKMSDCVRESVGLPVGMDGCYFVGNTHDSGQDHTVDIIDFNKHPSGQPGFWCHWEPSSNGEEIQWNKIKQFYSYVEWLQYLIDHFFTPWGYKLNGCVQWRGEEKGDFGVIEVNDSKIDVLKKCLASFAIDNNYYRVNN